MSEISRDSGMHCGMHICIPPDVEYFAGHKITSLFSTIELCCVDTNKLLFEAKRKIHKDEYMELIYRTIINHIKDGLQKIYCKRCERREYCREARP